MQEPPWSGHKKSLARRIRLGYIFRELSFWVPAGLISWGLMVFLVRVLFSGRVDVLWTGGVFLLVSAGIGVYQGCRHYADVNVTAVLDHLSDSENLLISLEETGSSREAWVAEAEKQLDEDVSMPGFRWGRLSSSVLPALAFLLLVWFVPLSGLTDQAKDDRGSYLQERVEELREKLDEVKSEDLMADEKAERIEEKLSALQKELEQNRTSGDNPWSVMDRVDQEMEAAMTEGSETLNRARKLSHQLSEELNRSKSDGSSEDRSSDSSGSESRSGTGPKGANASESTERQERQKEALSRSLARLSRRGMTPDPSEVSSEEQDTNYQNRQKPHQNNGKKAGEKGSQKNLRKNWKKLASRRKTLKKLKRKLRKKHRRMHRKGICRGGSCRLNGNKQGRSGKKRIVSGNGKKKGMSGKKRIVRGNGKKKGMKTNGGTKKEGGGVQTKPREMKGNPPVGSGSPPMTDGETSGKEKSEFATQKVDAPVVNPEGMKTLDERVQPGQNLESGEASVSSGKAATVQDPLESRRSSVPPDYRESVKSYFDPESD